MPHFSLHIREESLTDKNEPELIRALTDAVATVYGEEFRPLVGVELIGVPQRRRGIGGVPTGETAPEITLSLREGAFHLPQLPDAPARLVTAITDGVTGVLGEDVRDQVLVTLTGVPEGRSGVAGAVA